jgi:transposase-like protein
VSAVEHFSIAGPKFSDPPPAEVGSLLLTYFECPDCQERFMNREGLEVHRHLVHRPKTSPYPDEVREEALRLVGEGLSDKEAARRVHVSDSTVRKWRIASAGKAADTPEPPGDSAPSPERQPTKDGASSAHTGSTWIGTRTFGGFVTESALERVDFVRLLLLAARFQGRNWSSDPVARDFARCAVDVAIRALGLPTPAEQEDTP